MNDINRILDDRQSGRTTRGLQEARLKNRFYIVHAIGMVHYCKQLMPGVDIVLLELGFESHLRCHKKPVVDHAVWEYARPSLIQDLRNILRTYPE